VKRTLDNSEKQLSVAFTDVKFAYLELLNEIKMFDAEVYESLASVLDHDESNVPYICENFCLKLQEFALICKVDKVTSTYLNLGDLLKLNFAGKDLQIALRFSATFIDLATTLFQISEREKKGQVFSPTIKGHKVLEGVLVKSKFQYLNFLNDVLSEDRSLHDFFTSLFSLEKTDLKFRNNYVEKLKCFCRQHSEREFFSYTHILWREDIYIFCSDEMVVVSGVLGKYRSLAHTLSTIFDPPFRGLSHIN